MTWAAAVDCRENVTKTLLLPSGHSHRFQCQNHHYLTILTSLLTPRYKLFALFLILSCKKIIFLTKSLFRQCAFLLFGSAGGITDRHRSGSPWHSLRRWQVHHRHRQLHLRWIGPGNLHLCRHAESGWKLHKDWISTHKLTGHVSSATILGESWVILKCLISRVEAVPRRSPLLVLQFPEGKSLLTVDWVGVLARFSCPANVRISHRSSFHQ